MSLEIVRGTIRNNVAIQSLIAALKNIGAQGTLYAGYPIIASADSSHTIEALLVSQAYGLVAFNCPNQQDQIDSVKDAQDQIFYLIEGNLKKHETLRKGRNLAFSPNVVSFYPTDHNIPESVDQYRFAGPGSLGDVLAMCSGVEPDYFRPLCAAVQRVTTIKPAKKRENVQKPNSKGAILKVIEKEIANLDQWQKKAAIEVPDGPQRVRGLAGSGKTVVLALKAAYLHAQHPDWNIVVTFHTRSLSQQFKDLIERFTLEHSGDKPNWDRLRILHAWGSSGEPGVYSDIADSLNVVPVNYASAKSKYGSSGAFEGICSEITSYISQATFEPIYDAILIDEAQDLPIPFFRMVYAATKQPKRIVWAYDELQNLSNTFMSPVDQLFGKDKNGNPLVSVNNNENEAQQDIILPVCYRNTPWALTLAHALGFGIYRSAGLVQLFDDLDLWKEIGYTVDSGTLQFNNQVILKRKADSFPSYFKDLITPEDAVVAKRFENRIDQYEWIASEIHKNISEDEMDPDDVLVIFPNAYTSKQQFQTFNQSLTRRGLNAHLAGVSTDRDTFTRANSITAASIYRAKGNEAPMVYIVNSEWCASGLEMIRLRNVLFTAITRSRAWVRICGVGDEMEILETEIASVRENEYKLAFKVPTQDELKNIRLINRDRTVEEKGKISKAIRSIKEIKELIDSGVINPEMMPELKSLIEIVSGFTLYSTLGITKNPPLQKRLEECMNILDFLGPRVPLLPPPQPVVEDVMISGDIFKTIHHLKKNGFGIKSIARRLDLDPGTVRKYLNQTEIQPYSRDCPATSSLTGLEEWLRARAPEVGFNGKILFREARGQGFAGSYSIIKRFLRPIREKERVATEATVRFETPPGLQGQVDWGSSKVWLGENRCRVHFFVLVLGFSRRLFVRAYLNEKRHNVIDGHQRAFAWFGGYPKEVLYDNARTMVMTERPPAERLNKVFADFARHHGFEARFCRPYRPRTKGKVESGVKYVKRNFLAGRRFRDLDDLNASLEQWMREEADVRVHGTTHVTPMSRWAEESSALIPLSAVRPWQPDLEHIRRVANDSRITVGTNRYPVVPSAIGKTVAVHVEAGKIEVRNEAGEVVGSHEQLHGRYQEAPMPKEFHALLAEVAKKAERTDLPRHDPRWPENDVQVRNLSIYDEVAGIKEVA